MNFLKTLAPQYTEPVTLHSIVKLLILIMVIVVSLTTGLYLLAILISMALSIVFGDGIAIWISLSESLKSWTASL